MRNNIPFVIWMLGYPVCYNLTKYLRLLTEGPEFWSPGASDLALLINLIIYVWIAVLLYEGRKSEKADKPGAV